MQKFKLFCSFGLSLATVIGLHLVKRLHLTPSYSLHGQNTVSFAVFALSVHRNRFSAVKADRNCVPVLA